jgi:hypothetical protein
MIKAIIAQNYPKTGEKNARNWGFFEAMRA